MSRCQQKNGDDIISLTGIDESDFNPPCLDQSTQFYYDTTKQGLEQEGDIEYASKQMILLDQVNKVYTSDNAKPTHAVRGLVYNSPMFTGNSKVFGLLGANGGGKSTLFKMLLGIEPPTSGRLGILGLFSEDNIASIRAGSGYCPQENTVPESMSVEQLLFIFAKVKLSRNRRLSLDNLDEEAQLEVEDKLELLDIKQYRQRAFAKLSGGNKRKVMIGICMIGRPRIQFVDEPSAGVDPISRRKMRQAFQTRAEESESFVVITTHVMEEAEAMCRELALQAHGTFHGIGTSDYLKQRFGGGYIVRIQWDTNFLLNDNESRKVELAEGQKGLCIDASEAGGGGGSGGTILSVGANSNLNANTGANIITSGQEPLLSDYEAQQQNPDQQTQLYGTGAAPDTETAVGINPNLYFNDSAGSSYREQNQVFTKWFLERHLTEWEDPEDDGQKGQKRRFQHGDVSDQDAVRGHPRITFLFDYDRFLYEIAQENNNFFGIVPVEHRFGRITEQIFVGDYGCQLINGHPQNPMAYLCYRFAGEKYPFSYSPKFRGSLPSKPVLDYMNRQETKSKLRIFWQYELLPKVLRALMSERLIEIILEEGRRALSKQSCSLVTNTSSVSSDTNSDQTLNLKGTVTGIASSAKTGSYLAGLNHLHDDGKPRYPMPQDVDEFLYNNLSSSSKSSSSSALTNPNGPNPFEVSIYNPYRTVEDNDQKGSSTESSDSNSKGALHTTNGYGANANSNKDTNQNHPSVHTINSNGQSSLIKDNSNQGTAAYSTFDPLNESTWYVGSDPQVPTEVSVIIKSRGILSGIGGTRSDDPNFSDCDRVKSSNLELSELASVFDVLHRIMKHSHWPGKREYFLPIKSYTVSQVGLDVVFQRFIADSQRIERERESRIAAKKIVEAPKGLWERCFGKKK